MMDVISKLPDEVLSHVLSFLTTKEAALTSVLSKKWRNLFAFVPNLEFDDSVFLNPEEGKRERDGILQSFMDFVDRVLALQGASQIEKVSLKCRAGVDSDRVNRWICNLLKRGVSELDLFVSFGDNYRLPVEIFKSRTLVKLSLGGGIKLAGWDGDSVIYLPMLKTLNLDTVEFCIGQFQMLLCGCPVLKILYMGNVEWEDRKVTVSSASLKSLAIKSEACLEELSFDTPNLVYLDYSEFLAGDYPVVNLENVVQARIDLVVNQEKVKLAREPANDGLENERELIILQFSNAKKLMKGLRNVQKLFLSPTTLEVLSVCSEVLPVFNNLTFLNILSHVDLGWQAVPVLLKNCPHLKTLYLGRLLHYVTDKCGDACDCISREDKGSSLSSSPVKRLYIIGFRGTPRELQMIKHFLYSFPCLEKMEIHAERHDTTTNFEIPGMLEYVEELMISYNDLTTCDVQFMVCDSFYKKWGAK